MMNTRAVPQPRSAAPSTFTPGRGLLLQRKCACGGSCGLTGRCTECEKKKLVGQPLQTKLRISEPGDQYEQEADRVAEQVMRMADSDFNPGHLQSAAIMQRRAAGDELANAKGSMVQRVEATGEAPASEGVKSDDTGPAQDEGSRCPSWRADPQSISKRAAETYVQNDMTPPSQATVERIECEPPRANGNYGCYVHFSDGLVIRVIVREKDIVVGTAPINTMTPPAATPLCFYDYDCPNQEDLVLTKRECKSAKPAAPTGPTLVGQRRAAPGASGPMDATPRVNSVLTAPGQPLDATTRGFFSARFGHDFGKVRVHTGTDAERSARDVNAQAYTVGHDIVFDTGRYLPGTHEGRRLLAHELTHVVQQTQNGAQSRSSHATSLDDSDELEAEHAASKVLLGEPTRIASPAPFGALQRQEKKNPLDDKAKAIIAKAKDTTVDADKRAVQLVKGIIAEYYPGDMAKVDSVVFDDPKAGTGLQTESVGSGTTTKGKISVGIIS